MKEREEDEWRDFEVLEYDRKLEDSERLESNLMSMLISSQVMVVELNPGRVYCDRHDGEELEWNDELKDGEDLESMLMGLYRLMSFTGPGCA